MARLKVMVVALVAAAFAVFCPAPARADCVQSPVVVPGLSGGPVWFPPTPGSTAWTAQLHDPRWAGDPMRFFPVKTGGGLPDQYDAQYRVVQVGNTLYVSIQVLADPAIDTADFVYFGITGGVASSGAQLVAISPDGTDTPVSDPTGRVQHDAVFPIPNSSFYITSYNTLNAGIASPSWCETYPISSPSGCPAALAAPPSWLTNVATWTNSPGVVWAVTFQVDTTTISSGPMKMFFGTQISMTAGTTVILSSSAQLDGTAIGTTPVGASVANWVSFSALGSACPTGITISPTTVGVWDTASSSLTNSINTCPGSSCTNKFRVEAQNVPTAGTTQFAVRTRIRVADWGSTIADPNAPWEDFGIPPDVYTQPQTYFLTGPAAAQWAWAQPTAGTTSTANIDFTCALDGVAGHTYCPWVVNAKAANQPHQCMLFEISLAPGVSGPGWNIQTAAVYRNMEYGVLSKLDEPARITLAGLQKLTGIPADRDVYVYVKTENMPPHGRATMELSQERLSAARAYATHPPPIPPRPVQIPIRDVKGAQVAGPRDAGAAPQPAAIGPLDLPLLTGDQALSQAYPTYRVFTYYDSGRTITVKGHVQKVLVPMAPFGFFLDHQGAFYGFKHSLEFLDGAAKEIAPNFYVIHVKNEGELHVRTKVSAEERPLGEQPPPPPQTVRCACDVVRSSEWSPLAVGLAGLGVAGLWLRSRRRRRG